MVERAGRGWCLSREGVISLVGDSHWEPDDPPGLDLPPAVVNTPCSQGKVEFFSSPMFLRRQNASSGLPRLRSRKHVHLRTKLSCQYPNLDTKEGKITRAKAVGWSARH